MQVTHDCLRVLKQLSVTLEGGFTLQRHAHRGVAGWTTRAAGAWWVWEGMSTIFFLKKENI